ncbi:type II toxin-antitoxin system RelE/ParE family toxin [Candidatus Woesearchaeota archaeon]|nr:type II toxin-antitoxin system RelE/ParE family toxin [Candidatus Woesearchaeota archaeon]
MAFKIYHSFTFDRKLDKMQKDFKDWLENIEAQLETNPYVGDQIRFRWFREKKRGKYRIYYLIYEDIQAVYLVNLSEKKDQQSIINACLIFLDNFKEEIKNLIK